MNTFAQKLILLLSDESLRNRVLFVLGALIIFRVFAAIPMPGVNAAQLELFFSNNQFLGLLNLFSGGGLSSLSIVLLGVGPYITASIIMQLLTLMMPRIKQLYQEEGEIGRKKFTQYTRLLTLPLSVIQGISFLLILERAGVVTSLTPFNFATNLIVITAGSMLLMWLGELISEYGIGNGISLLIFGGIVAGVPSPASPAIFTFDTTQIPVYVAFLAAAVAVVAAIVLVSEAERPVPVTYAKRVRGMKFFGGASTYLPLRLNQAGVIPIIFALSFLLVPQMLIGITPAFFATSSNVLLAGISNAVLGGL